MVGTILVVLNFFCQKKGIIHESHDMLITVFWMIKMYGSFFEQIVC